MEKNLKTETPVRAQINQSISMDESILLCRNEAIDNKSKAFLPSINTDITLESTNRKIIIDTKYYGETLNDNRGKLLVRSDHLYQIFSYLSNADCSAATSGRYEGILLYPTVEEDIALHYELGGYPISVRTINLNQEWSLVHRDLLAIIS